VLLVGRDGSKRGRALAVDLRGVGGQIRKPSRMDTAKQHVRGQLEAIDYEVDPIEESGGREGEAADLRATLAGEPSIVIEVKSREEDQDFIEALAAAPPGEIVPRRPKKIGYNATTSDLIQKALSQINSSRRADTDLACIWLLVRDAAMANQGIDQFEATLLGRSLAWCRSVKGLMPVYYAGITRFYGNPKLDFVIAQDRIPVTDFTSDGRQVLIGEQRRDLLLLNPFSDRLSEVMSTTLYKHFQKLDAVSPMPQDLEARGEAFLVDLDADVELRDKEAVEAFLRAKYPQAEIVGLENLQVLGGAVNIEPPGNPGTPGE